MDPNEKTQFNQTVSQPKFGDQIFNSYAKAIDFMLPRVYGNKDMLLKDLEAIRTKL